MSGDYSRWSFDPQRHFGAVLMQQGRVHTDADWNEWVVSGAAPRPRRQPRHARRRGRAARDARRLPDRSPRAARSPSGPGGCTSTASSSRTTASDPRSGIRGWPSCAARPPMPYDEQPYLPRATAAARAAGPAPRLPQGLAARAHCDRGAGLIEPALASTRRRGSRPRGRSRCCPTSAPASPAPRRSRTCPASSRPSRRRLAGSPPAPPTWPASPTRAACRRAAATRASRTSSTASRSTAAAASRRRPRDVQVVARQRHRRHARHRDPGARPDRRRERRPRRRARLFATATGSRSPTTGASSRACPARCGASRPAAASTRPRGRSASPRPLPAGAFPDRRAGPHDARAQHPRPPLGPARPRR